MRDKEKHASFNQVSFNGIVNNETEKKKKNGDLDRISSSKLPN